MSCHFQMSIEQDPDPTGRKGGLSPFRVRLRKDGHQWQSKPMEIDPLNPSAVAYVVDQWPTEEVLWFKLHGPTTLPMEDSMAQLGWCLAHCPAFAKEMAEVNKQDLLSVRGQRLPMDNPKQLFTQARAQARPMQEQRLLQEQTPKAPKRAKRPRL